jgi:nucleoside-diphosphate-sugar epimerase
LPLLEQMGGCVVADRVLVTGASGFIAKHCIAELIKSGYDVRGTVRRKAAEPEVVAAVSKLVDPTGHIEFAPLDLGADQGWDDALRGCRYLLHVASPFPLGVPKNPADVIRTAVDGTRRALAAAARNGIERAVVTSSTLAINSGHARRDDYVLTEKDWSNTDSPTISPYNLSKTLAERTAWDFIGNDKSGMTLSVVNPGFVLGPTLDRDISASAEVVLLILSGAFPAVPHADLTIVDVRDVAAMHVLVLKAPNAAGERFLCCNETLWMKQFAQILHANFPAFRRKIPTRELPDFMVRMVALFDSTLRSVVPDLSHPRPISNEKARKVLGFQFRSNEEAIVAMAQSLIDLGLVKVPGAKA